MWILGVLLLIAAAPAPSKTFLIFPLESRSQEAGIGWVGEGLACTLEEDLRAAGMRVIGREERYRLTEGADLPPGLPLSRASMIRLADLAAANFLVFGFFEGRAGDLRIGLQVLDMGSLRLGGLITGNGPLSALPQIENELSWLILRNNDLVAPESREEHRKRMRVVPNPALESYLEGVNAADDGAALSALLKAVKICPEFPEARYRLGRLLYRQGNFEEAARHLAAAGQDNLEARFLLGNCHLGENRLEQAIREYESIAAVAESPATANNLAVACLRKGDFARAGSFLSAAAALAPSDATISLNMAVLRLAEGDHDAALLLTEGFLGLHPSSAMLLFLRGEILLRTGRTQEGKASIERAQHLGIDPESLQHLEPTRWARIFEVWKY